MQLKRTPLYELHCELGAKLVDFSGWELPVFYRGIKEEHLSTRNACGLFDVSHMGRIWLKGEGAFPFLQYLTTNDVSRLNPGRAQYTLLLNECSGVIDDVILYQLDEDKFFLCVNASNLKVVKNWLLEHLPSDCELSDLSEELAQLALQGPKAREVLGKVLNTSVAELANDSFPSFHIKELSYSEGDEPPISFLAATTGYSGEDGFEVYMPKGCALSFCRKVLGMSEETGVVPVGLGARDTLRLEACFPLHGHELSPERTVVGSGLEWAIRPNKGAFFGSEVYLAEREAAKSEKLVAFEVLDRGIVRANSLLLSGDKAIGIATSGTQTPTIGKAIGLGYVSREYSERGTEFEADVRGRRLKVRVCAKPFYRRNNGNPS